MNRCFYVSEIDWDTDGEKIDGLPTEVIVELDHCDEDDDFEMYIVNELSDNFGWFVNSFTFELMPEEVEE